MTFVKLISTLGLDNAKYARLTIHMNLNMYTQLYKCRVKCLHRSRVLYTISVLGRAIGIPVLEDLPLVWTHDLFWQPYLHCPDRNICHFLLSERGNNPL